MHTNTCRHCHKHTHTHSYISINTVPSRSPCAELLIASLILICQIPLGSYHWRVSLRVKNTMLSSLVPSLAFPTPWFKNSSGLNRPPCVGKDSATLSLSVRNALSQRAVVHRPKCVCLSLITVSEAGPYSKAGKHRRMVHINILVSVVGCEQWRSKPDVRRDSIKLWPSSRQHCDNCNNSMLEKTLFLFKMFQNLHSYPSTKSAKKLQKEKKCNTLVAKSNNRHANMTFLTQSVFQYSVIIDFTN